MFVRHEVWINSCTAFHLLLTKEPCDLCSELWFLTLADTLHFEIQGKCFVLLDPVLYGL